jgi:hypothetical protein
MTVRPRFPALAILALVVSACSTPTATATLDATPTATPAETEEATASPEESATPSEEPPEAAPDELDPQLASNYGSTDLTAGFSPDPFSVDIVSGGPIDVSYLGNDCRGSATPSSDYDVTYTAGAQSLLRFYFVAETADTTLIINAPDGSWHCNDDAPGTIDPMVDFPNPDGGRYDIWIGSYESGTENAGTLYVTELESNSP